MKKIMIFDNSLDGHHMEYLHHIYMAACEKFANMLFFFVVPQEFEEKKSVFEWPECEWVKIVFMEKEDVCLCERGGYFSKAWNYSKILKKYADAYNINELFLITLIYPFPFLQLFLRSKVNVSGIIYRIYLYEWHKLTFLKKCKDAFETFVMAHSKCVKSILVLNDNSAKCYFNKLFRVGKFDFVVDPILPLSYTPKNIREELGLSNADKVYLHFGAMNERKGTMLILEALDLLKENELKGKCFVFAGKIGNDIKKYFYEKKASLEGKVKILVYDRFCTYEFLNDLCASCDVILIPYKNTSYSSGIIGHAALLKKRVIAPYEGILGKLVKRNKLGVVSNISTPEDLSQKILTAEIGSFYPNKYVMSNSIGSFCDKIFSLWI